MKKIIKIKEPLKIKNDVVSDYLVLGHFNVIHKGHYNLFKKLKNFSFMIFENNPSKLYTVYNLNERIENILRFNPAYIYVYDILRLNLEADEFIENILKKLNFKKIIVGSDFRFGKDRSGDIELLKKHFDVCSFPKDGYSTSEIVNLLKTGKIEDANKMLVNNFYYENEVIKGKMLARKIFKPTANILDNKALEIMSGSYASMVKYKNKFYKGITFIGIPKSFEDNKSIVETYIFDFDKDIYGEKIIVYPLHFIRENQKFNDIKELEKVINGDLENAKKYFETFSEDEFKP